MSKNPINYNTIDMNRDPLKPTVNKGKRKKLNRMVNIYIIIGFFMLLIANLVIASPILLPYAYQFYPEATNNEVENLTSNLETDRVTFSDITAEAEAEKDETESEETPEPKPEDLLPPLDETLPATNSVIISKIGVNSPITESADFDAALQKGSWIVNDFGTPPEPGAPIIIASHRFGGIGWSQEQRNSMSFYRLTETAPGDQVEIIWGQRKYVYEIYSGEENSQITDYNADLILYTCKVLWQSPDRIFRYAKRAN